MADLKPEFHRHVIDFPSDRVTLRQLRLLLVEGRPLDLEEEGLDLSVMQLVEDAYARFCFAQAAGLREESNKALHDLGVLTGEPPNPPDCPGATQLLSEHYRRYGIADGLETTRQLLRRLAADAERQAVAQTRGSPS